MLLRHVVQQRKSVFSRNMHRLSGLSRSTTVSKEPAASSGLPNEAETIYGTPEKSQTTMERRKMRTSDPWCLQTQLLVPVVELKDIIESRKVVNTTSNTANKTNWGPKARI